MRSERKPIFCKPVQSLVDNRVDVEEVFAYLFDRQAQGRRFGCGVPSLKVV